MLRKYKTMEAEHLVKERVDKERPLTNAVEHPETKSMVIKQCQ